MTGTIQRIIKDKGFGFIKVDGAAQGAKEMYFHASGVIGRQFDSLSEGQRVEFDQGADPKGRGDGIRAINVVAA